MTIATSAEFKQRQSRLASALAAAGLRGAVIFSRGGSTLDRHGDVLYLTGFYQSYGYLPDEPNLFSGRAHSALVISADGRCVLCVAVKEYEADTLGVDDIRVSPDFSGTVAGALVDLGLTKGAVGMIGADVLPLTQYRLISSKCPELSWVDCDELLQAGRRIKSASEQEAIRRAARLHVSCIKAMREVAAPGVTEADLVAAFGQTALRGGAGLYFTAMSSGPSIYNWCSKPAPGFSTRRLNEGDMVRFDMGIVLDGYLSDFGRTWVIGEASPDQHRLIDAVQTGVDAVIAAIRPGRTVREVVAVGEATLRRLGVAEQPSGPGIIHSSFPVHWGHGLGMGWERPFMTENDAPIEPAMYLAIERTLTLPGVGTAAAEHTLLVTQSGVELLSAAPEGRWS